MKIVDRKTFLAMPAGTVYAKYEPCVFGDLEIKGDTIGGAVGDWFVQYLDGDAPLDELMSDDDPTAGGRSFGLDFDGLGRDGLFEDGQLFAVWEPVDVLALIDRLQRALVESGGLEPPTTPT